MALHMLTFRNPIPGRAMLIDNIPGRNVLIEKYINKCFIEKVDKITVITGKGNRSNNKNDPYKSEKLSILKYSVPEFIKSNLNLMKIIKKISSIDIEDNLKGSFEIYLKKIKE